MSLPSLALEDLTNWNYETFRNTSGPNRMQLSAAHVTSSLAMEGRPQKLELRNISKHIWSKPNAAECGTCHFIPCNARPQKLELQNILKHISLGPKSATWCGCGPWCGADASISPTAPPLGARVPQLRDLAVHRRRQPAHVVQVPLPLLGQPTVGQPLVECPGLIQIPVALQQQRLQVVAGVRFVEPSQHLRLVAGLDGHHPAFHSTLAPSRAATCGPPSWAG